MTITAEPDLNYGEVFTRRWVVDVLLDLTGYTVDRDLGAMSLLEPSCGSGAFLLPAVERLVASARSHGRDITELSGAIRAYDLQGDHVDRCRVECVRVLSDAGVAEAGAAHLADHWIRRADFLIDGLLSEVDDSPVDVAIGNPPYIRYDDLPEGLAGEYRRAWTTMSGRGDIYVGFFERCLKMLKPGGRVGFICADRWMRNQYGSALRDFISGEFAVEHVWTMHDVDAFESQVSAYPAITVIANRPQTSVIVADTTATFGAASAHRLAHAAQDASLTEFADVGVQAHRLRSWFRGPELWPTGPPARLALIEHLASHFAPLQAEETGTKISIGIATGADRIFVTDDHDLVEASRLVPLVTGADLTTGECNWGGRMLVNPWDARGRLVDLADYPRLATYFARFPELRDRFVSHRDPNAWYRTIDKITPGLRERPKLLFQDMKTRISPVLEPGKCYPHHNLYYVISETWDLEVLGGLLLSRVAQAFIEAFCVRMRGGTLRFQAQYLRQIRVPDPMGLDRSTAESLADAFRQRDVDAATVAAAAAYGIDLAEFGLLPSASVL